MLRLVSCGVFRSSILTKTLATGIVVILSACAGGAASPDSTNAPQSSVIPTSIAPSTGGTLSWKSCSGDSLDPLLCATLKVPYDYDNPSIGSFTLKIVKRPADVRTKRIGTMLVNPGGPGFGGTYLAENADSYFSKNLMDSFDIVGWDPRGTGESTPAVDCIKEFDKYFAVDPSPDSPAEKQDAITSSKEFDAECAKNSGPILPYISTNSTVRDMDRIRAAIGEEKITYFGFSYGSELGATWATMFPTTVRAAVLDGASDPTSDSITGGLQQAKGFETELNKFLARCSSNVKCPFYNKGNAEGAFDALIISLDSNPLVVNTKRASVNQAIAYTAVAQAMYSSSIWDQLETALAKAQKGNGAGLLALNDAYYQRSPDGTYGNELEAFIAITCLDDPGPLSVAEMDSYTPEFLRVAPRLGPSFAGGYACVFWPAKPNKRIDITGNGAGPIVVVGTTGDAATPLASSRKMAETLQDGRLVVVTEDRHTGYGANTCVTTAVDSYLITTKVTFAEKAC